MPDTLWEVIETYSNHNYQSGQDSQKLTIKIDDEKYTVLICKCKPMEVEPETFYKLQVDTICQGLDYSVCFVWYDASGQEYAKGYLPKDGKVLSPEGCCALEIEVLITGKHGELTVHTPLLQKMGPYTSRMVRICAVAHEMFNGKKDHTYAENVKTVERQIDEVGKTAPDIVVLTEYVFQTKAIPDNGEPVPLTCMDSPEVNMLRGKAKQYHCYIVCSIKEIDADGIKHNTGILIDREGKINGIYRKTHLTIGEREAGIHLADELPVFDTDFGRIGIQICWDHFFPEATRILALKGAELIVMPTHGFMECRAMCRAVDNGIYVATAYFYEEGTVVYGPDGTVLDKAIGKGYAMADIDLNKMCFVRYLSCNSRGEPNDYYLHERRPELYAALAEK